MRAFIFILALTSVTMAIRIHPKGSLLAEELPSRKHNLAKSKAKVIIPLAPEFNNDKAACKENVRLWVKNFKQLAVDPNCAHHYVRTINRRVCSPEFRPGVCKTETITRSYLWVFSNRYCQPTSMGGFYRERFKGISNEFATTVCSANPQCCPPGYGGVPDVPPACDPIDPECTA